MKPPTATSALRQWYAANQDMLKARFSDALVPTRERNSCGLRLDGDAYFISICAWDQGQCLDIEVLDGSTGMSRHPAVGPCESIDDLLARLDSFAQWITQTIPDSKDP
ncbi:MAG: hypothetical protein KDI71_14425 [Xanthomonadales bacterium]|nr:hypothetical protein [Xanthomonadales bacterium]